MPDIETPQSSNTVIPQEDNTVIPQNSKTVEPQKENKIVTPDVSTVQKPDEGKPDDAINRLNGRIDELERKYGERQQAPEKIETRTPDEAPKSTHPWFRNPFVSG